MDKVLQRIKTNAAISALIYAVLGLVLVIWPGFSADLLCILLGAVLLVCGAVNILGYFSNRDGSMYSSSLLVLGIVLAVVGLWIMGSPNLILTVIPRIIGVLICIHGLTNLGDARTLRVRGYERWLTAFILALVTLVLGVVLVFDPFQAVRTVMRVLGLFLLFDGLSDLWITTRVSRVLKQTDQDTQAQRDAVDVDFRDIP